MGYDDPIEGIGDRRRGSGGLSPAERQWQHYLERQDADAAAEEEARAGRIPAEAAAPPPPLAHAPATGLLGAVAGVAASAASGPHREDRFALMAAMQAEALSRLEVPVVADNVGAGVRAADRLDEASRQDAASDLERKRLDGQVENREQMKQAGNLTRPGDYVAEVAPRAARGDAERRDDLDHARRHGLAGGPSAPEA